jgi:hypothetical protein
MSLDKRGDEGIRAAVRRLVAAVARPEVHVTVQRRDLELLILSRVQMAPQAPVAPPQLHPGQR